MRAGLKDRNPNENEEIFPAAKSSALVYCFPNICDQRWLWNMEEGEWGVEQWRNFKGRMILCLFLRGLHSVPTRKLHNPINAATQIPLQYFLIHLEFCSWFECLQLLCLFSFHNLSLKCLMKMYFAFLNWVWYNFTHF